MQIIKGKVQKGRGLGKKLGFPTLNIPYDGGARGVFAAQVWIGDLQYRAAVSVGPRPTLDDEEVLCEAFLLDEPLDFEVDAEVKVVLVQRIREIEKFPSLEALQLQISEDVVIIKNLLK